MITLNTPPQICLKPLQKKQQEATGELIGNRTVKKVTQNSPRSNSQTEESIEMPKERYISPEKRQQIIDDLRLI